MIQSWRLAGSGDLRPHPCPSSLPSALEIWSRAAPRRKGFGFVLLFVCLFILVGSCFYYVRGSSVSIPVLSPIFAVTSALKRKGKEMRQGQQRACIPEKEKWSLDIWGGGALSGWSRARCHPLQRQKQPLCQSLGIFGQIFPSLPASVTGHMSNSHPSNSKPWFFLSCSPLYFGGQGLSLNLELNDSARLSRQQTQGSSCLCLLNTRISSACFSNGCLRFTLRCSARACVSTGHSFL